MTEKQYEQAATFWERKDAETKKMSREDLEKWINDFHDAHKVLTLSTGEGETIRCTPLEYTWHDGALWIFAEGGLKFRGLQENNHVAAAVFTPNVSFGNLQSLQIEGFAETVDLYSEEYNKAAEFRKIPLSTLQKLPEPMWLLKIVPTEITCLNSDFKKDGYGSRQIWKTED